MYIYIVCINFLSANSCTYSKKHCSFCCNCYSHFVYLLMYFLTCGCMCNVLRLLFGFMTTTGFMSMWISNTATAAMMLPITQAVLQQLKDETQRDSSDVAARSDGGRMADSSDSIVTSVRYKPRSYDGIGSGGGGGGGVSRQLSDDGGGGSIMMEDKDTDSHRAEQHSTGGHEVVTTSSASGDDGFHRLAKSLMLGIAYSANIGGTGTLTGTGPTIVLAGLGRYVATTT